VIAQGLEGNDVAGLDEGAGDEVQGHLAAARDEDVVRAGGDTARGRQHLGQGRAQASVALRLGIRQHVDAVPRHRAAIRAREGRGRHQAHVGDAAGHPKDTRARGCVHEGQALGAQRKNRALRDTRRRRVRREADGRDLRHGPRDERARRLRRLDPALRGQLVVGGDHGVAMDVQRPREVAGAGQARARLQAPAAHVLGHRPRDLQEERIPAVRVEGHRKRPRRYWTSQNLQTFDF
jgi:hypothetical protein